jgi:hypothetical protein
MATPTQDVQQRALPTLRGVQATTNALSSIRSQQAVKTVAHAEADRERKAQQHEYNILNHAALKARDTQNSGP